MRINHKQIIDNAGQIGMLQRKSGVRRKKVEEKKTEKEITRPEAMEEKVEISSAALETATEVKEETPQEETLQTKTERHMGKLEGQYGKPDEKALRKQRPGDKRFTKKHGNTRLGTLEKTYGKIAPEGWDRDNTTLQDILDATGHSSLTQLLKHRKELKENPPELKTETMAPSPENKPVSEEKPPEQQIAPDQLPLEQLQTSEQQVLPEVKREELSQEAPPQEPAAPPPSNLPNAPGIIRYLNDRAFWREGYRSGFGDGTSPVQGRGGIPSPYWAKGYGEGFEDGRFTSQLHPAASWWPANGAIYNPFGTPEYIYPQAPARVLPGSVQSRTIYQESPKKSFLMAPPDGSPSPEGQPGKEKNYHYKMKNGSTFYDKFLPDGSREQKVTGRDGETIKQVTVDSEGNQVCTSFAKDGSSKVETSEGKVMVFDKNGIMVQNYVENPPVSPEENFWQRVPPEANKTAPDPAVTKNLGKDDTITTYNLPDGNKFSEVKTACDGREHQVLTDGRGNMLQTVTRDPIRGEQVKNIYNSGGSVISEGNNGYAMAVDRNGRGQMYGPDGRPVMGNNYTPSYGMSSYGMPSYGMPSYGMPSYGMPSYGMMPGYGMMMPNYAMMGGLGMLGGLGMMGMGMMMPGGLGMMGYGLGGMMGGMFGSRLGYGMGGMWGGMLGGALGWGLGGMLGGGLGMGLGMGWGGLGMGMGWGLGGAMTMGGMGMAGLGNIYADGWLGW